MNPPAPGGPRADITVYRWSERSLTGRGDVGPVATSLDREELLRWNSRIENMVWATQDHPGDTTPGFVYLRHGPEAAVLRKLPVRDPHGRAGSTLTHVLTGPATAIDLHLALAVCRSDWDDWLPPQIRQGALLHGPGSHATPPEKPQRVPLDLLRRLLLEEKRLLDALDTAAADLPDELLLRLAEALMEEPGAPLTVLGAPVDGEVVVHALAGLLGRVVESDWSFATREENDGARELPQFVFLRRDSAGAPQPDRRRIDAEADPGPAGPLRDQAARLVAFRRRRGEDGLARLAPARPLGNSAQIREWAAGHQVAPGLMSDVTSLLEAAPDGDLTQKEAAYLRSPASLPRVQLELDRMTDGRLARLVALWRPDTLELEPYRHLRPEIHTRALHRCLDSAADGVPDLVRELAVRPPEDRVALRVLHERMERAAHRRTSFDVLPLLRTAQEIGVSRAALDHMMKVMVERFAMADLLSEIDRVSRVAPDQARTLLEHSTRRRDAGRERRDPFDMLRRTGFLAAAVERMAPQNPWQAVRLYRLVLLCAVGESPGQREVLEVLDAAGRTPSPYLLQALADSCRRGRAQDTVFAAVVQQYFREHLPARPDDGPGRGPARRDPWS
ncbi:MULTISPECIES: hypothetical protein [unclassified Streptomyces]|uniref:hypothetical protein n=1 Tax=unclassified Streptomyces TaxID=2593676 RepID=UPI0036ECE835